MKKIHQVTIFIFLLFLVNSANALTVKQYEDTIKIKDKETQTMIKMYISGLGQGYYWANLLSKRDLKDALFCPPEEMALNFENYKNILEEEIKKTRKMILSSGKKEGFKSLEETPIGMILLFGLKDTFPCSK